MLIAGSVMVLAGLTLRASGRVVSRRTPRWLMRASAVSVFAPMPLAIEYTLAKVVAVPALDIPAMAAVHGTLNALVVCLCGLAAWLMVRRDRGEQWPG